MNIFAYFTNVPLNEWITFIIFFTSIVIFIGLSEVLRKKAGWGQEINRKLVHILTGVLVFFSPLLFKYSTPLILMGTIFTIINLAGVLTDSLKGMSSERKSYGTVFFPVSFIILVLTCWPDHKLIIMVSILIMGIADAAAAFVGESVKSPHTYNPVGEQKSFEGSAAMFASTFIITLVLIMLLGHVDNLSLGFFNAMWIAVLAAFFITAMEAVSVAGSDNLSVPLGAAFIINILIEATASQKLFITSAALFAIVVAYLSYRMKALNKGGSVATFIVGFIVFGIGGVKWAVPILTFFILSSILSKIQKKRKKQYSLMFEKTDTRDAVQVAANGGIAGSIVVLNYFFPSNIWYYAFLGALAAVTSDTWATELGVLSKEKPVSLKNLRQTDKGSSGGISWLGTFSGFIGSFIIVLAGLFSAPSMFPAVLIPELFIGITVAGLLGSFIDSIAGAFFQAQYQCKKCGQITEKKIHCDGYKTSLVAGVKWVTNDVVNFICSATGASAAFFVVKFFV